MSWSWVKKNVLGELPVIGPFLKEKTAAKAWHHAGKMTAELAGGSAGMILFMLNVPMPMMDESSAHDHQTSRVGYFAAMTGAMAAGMMVGGVTFNGLWGLACASYPEAPSNDELNLAETESAREAREAENELTPLSQLRPSSVTPTVT